MLQQVGLDASLQAAAAMQLGTVVPLDAPLAGEAGRLGAETRLPLADSIVLATARITGARLWTQDSDFEGLEGVEFRPKKR